MLRFLDVTIKPGHTYEYQVQVRMANPNLNKSDAEVAYHELTTMPELTSASEVTSHRTNAARSPSDAAAD